MDTNYTSKPYQFTEEKNKEDTEICPLNPKDVPDKSSNKYHDTQNTKPRNFYRTYRITSIFGQLLPYQISRGNRIQVLYVEFENCNQSSHFSSLTRNSTDLNSGAPKKIKKGKDGTVRHPIKIKDKFR